MSALEKPIQIHDQTSELAADAAIFLGEDVNIYELGPGAAPQLPELVREVQRLENTGRLLGIVASAGSVTVYSKPDIQPEI